MKIVSDCCHKDIYEEMSPGGTVYKCCKKCKQICDVKLYMTGIPKSKKNLET